MFAKPLPEKTNFCVLVAEKKIVCASKNIMVRPLELKSLNSANIAQVIVATGYSYLK